MSVQVRRDDGAGRYVAIHEGSVAGFAAYRREPGVVVLTHTEVDDRFEGHGVGSALVRGALDDVRAQGHAVEPLCPFVRSYLDRHDEYADLVAGPGRPAPR